MSAEGGELHPRLRLARESSGLTQVELATTAGIAVNTVKQYESGRIKPGADALAGYARAGINVMYLLLGEGEPLVVGKRYRAPDATVPLRIEEGEVAWHGSLPASRLVETVLAIVGGVDAAQAGSDLELSSEKRRAVVQALFEEYLESGAMPRPNTILRFIKAAAATQ